MGLEGVVALGSDFSLWTIEPEDNDSSGEGLLETVEGNGPDGVLDLGVAAVIGLQLQGLPVPVSDEAVKAVGGEEGQLGTRRGLDSPDDEPHRCGVGLTLKGSAGDLGHVGCAVHPVWDGPPVRLGYGLDQVPQAGVLADGDGEADIHLAADRDQGVGIEAAVGPHRELSTGPSVAHPDPPFHAGSGPASTPASHPLWCRSGSD